MRKILFASRFLLAVISIVSLSIITNAQSVNQDSLLEVIENLVYHPLYSGSQNLGDVATVKIPDNYSFLNAKEAQNFMEANGNPPDDEVMGILFPYDSTKEINPEWYFVIYYVGDGHIDDSDAKDFDFDELLEEVKNGSKSENEERKKLNLNTFDIISWASKPFYDSENKTLHFGELLKFSSDSINTLNYKLLVLGRDGSLLLNAIGVSEDLPSIKKNIPIVFQSVKFNPGKQYRDFDSSIDKVAAYGIGGLVAGKILAKVGFFAIIAKFAKVIIFGIVSAIAAAWRYITGKKKKEKELLEAQNEAQPENPTDIT